MAAGAAAGGGLAVGAPLAFVVLAGMEAGVPIPIPIDLVVLVIGDRVAAGSLSWPIAVIGLEVAAVLGTSLLLWLSAGPGRATLTRLGPRVGLTEARLARVTGTVARRGRGALVAGRATPGLRTVTVVAAGTAGLDRRQALLFLLLGSSVFLQAHLVLGILLGPAARALLEDALLPVLSVVAVVVVAATAVWIVRRRRGGRLAWIVPEATCPACLAVGLLSERRAGPDPAALRGLH